MNLLANRRVLLQQAPLWLHMAFRYLVNLLIEEEIRQHWIFSEIADSLKTEALLGGAETSVPYMDFDRVDRAGVLDATKQLIENEEQDARELKGLQRELRDVKDTSLWGLLIDLMQRDTQKHIAIHRFVRKHTRASGTFPSLPVRPRARPAHRRGQALLRPCVGRLRASCSREARWRNRD